MPVQQVPLPYVPAFESVQTNRITKKISDQVAEKVPDKVAELTP